MINFEIMFPISNYEEAEILLERWCKIFYWWVYFNWIFNWRKIKWANFCNLIELKKTIKLINKNNWEFNLAINAFEAVWYKDLKNIYLILNTLNWTKFNAILKDIRLIDFINTKFPNLDIHISTINWIMNSFWIWFFLNNFKNITKFCIEKTLNFHEMISIFNTKNELFWNKIQLEIISDHFWCTFIQWACILHSIFKCYAPIEKNPFCNFVEDCSYCAIFEMFYKNDINENIILKISWRERAFEKRLKWYDLLKKLIYNIKKKEFTKKSDIIKFRENNEICIRWECWYL